MHRLSFSTTLWPSPSFPLSYYIRQSPWRLLLSHLNWLLLSYLPSPNSIGQVNMRCCQLAVNPFSINNTYARSCFDTKDKWPWNWLSWTLFLCFILMVARVWELFNDSGFLFSHDRLTLVNEAFTLNYWVTSSFLHFKERINIFKTSSSTQKFLASVHPMKI